MLRLLIYLIVVGALGAVAASMAGQPGKLVITWFGYRIETSVFAALAAVLLAFALAVLLWSGIRGLLGAPGRLVNRMRARREQRGRDALRHGIFAVGAGDAQLAARHASEARQVLDNEPLTKLLRAQAAQISGDHATAKRIFETMLDEDETRLMGLHGLFLEARRDNNVDAAERFAAGAVEIRPALPWASEALFELRCRKGDWAGALNTLGSMRQHRLVDRKTADRRRAVLLTAQAQAIEMTNQERAGNLAQEAHGLAPDLVPAAEIAGRVLAAQGYVSRAARLLSRTWELSPHPDIALTYAYVRPGDSPRDRLNRVRALTRTNPDHIESRVALAAAAVDAHAWDEARTALEPLLAERPSRRVCTLMARIEAGDTRNAGRVREWLAKALRAPRDPAWVADGVVSDRWAPVSPVTGQLDAFEWRIPMERVAPADHDALPLEIAELDRLERPDQLQEVTVDEQTGRNDDDTSAAEVSETPEDTGRSAPEKDDAEPAAEPGRTDGDAGNERAPRASANQGAGPSEAVQKAEGRTNGGAGAQDKAVVFPLRAPDDPGPESDDENERSWPPHRVPAKNTR
ncbi:MAG: heme biosynthesis HemY N-terminal domain-containing protein [Dichotomicrobium sp.]